MSERISAELFQKRLRALCTLAGGAGLPRKQQDRHILFQAAAMALDPVRAYSESELNDALEHWLSETGRVIATDHVTMRRHLVDEHYLSRDPAGNIYRRDSRNDARFDPDVMKLHPAAIVAEGKAERAARRRIHTEQSH